MKFIITTLIVAATTTFSAEANILFASDFDSEAITNGTQFNATSINGFTVTEGSVDIAENGFQNGNFPAIFCSAMSAGCLDLDGTTPGVTPASEIQSTDISVNVGSSYQVRFEYSGNQRVDSSDSLRVAVDGYFDETIDGIAWDQNYIEFSRTFIATSSGLVNLVLSDPTTSDLFGVFVDNVTVREVVVPLPGAALIFFVGAAMIVRRTTVSSFSMSMA